MSDRIWRAAAFGLGLVEALLLARLVVRVLAGRPDNPAVAALLGLTSPLVAPLAFLDAGQPRFGAVLELSTLALILLLFALMSVIYLVKRRPATNVTRS